jgi:hypothetical protein
MHFESPPPLEGQTNPVDGNTPEDAAVLGTLTVGESAAPAVTDSTETPYTENDASELRSLLAEEENEFLPQEEIKVFEREGFRYVLVTPHELRSDIATGEPAPPIMYIPGATREANDRGPLTAARLATVCGQPVLTVHRNKAEWVAAFKHGDLKPSKASDPERYIGLDDEHAKPFISALADKDINEALGINEAAEETPLYDLFSYSRGTSMALLTIDANPGAFRDIYLHQPQGIGKLQTARRMYKGLQTAARMARGSSEKLEYTPEDLGIASLEGQKELGSNLPNRAEQLSVARAHNLEMLVSKIKAKNPGLRWIFSTDQHDIMPSYSDLVAAFGDTSEVAITQLGGHGIKHAHGIYHVVRAWYQKNELERAQLGQV